jgi:hypothetical protein
MQRRDHSMDNLILNPMLAGLDSMCKCLSFVYRGMKRGMKKGFQSIG